jgi:hypothetical protein
MSFGDFGAGGDVAPSKSYGSLASGREALGSVQRMGGAHATHVEHGADGSDGSQHMGYNEYGGGDQMGELGDGGEADHSAHMYSQQMGQYGYAAYGNYVMPGYNTSVPGESRRPSRPRSLWRRRILKPAVCAQQGRQCSQPSRERRIRSWRSQIQRW